MTAILGISAFYHDSAAALLVDGRVVAAAQEERFSRRKHDARFPSAAIEYCLTAANLTKDELTHVAFYDKPLLKFERLLETHLAFAPAGYGLFLAALPDWMRRKLHVPREIRRGLGGRYRKRIVFAEHHESHAASAFFPSPFEQAAILTADGVGEWDTASYGVGIGNRLSLSRTLPFPHSLGLLYSAFTYFCGFRVNAGEYKLMGLAPYGRPHYVKTILKHLVDLKADGSFRLNMDYFAYCRRRTMTSRRFDRLFGGRPREPDGPITQREMDLAASIQEVLEQIVLRTAEHVQRETRQVNLCLAGGVALNCVAIGRLEREGPFERIWVQPAAGDAGGALGVAYFVWHQLLRKPRSGSRADRQQASLLGPSFSSEQIIHVLDTQKAVHQRYEDESELLDRVARLLADQKVVGWFQGRMEFGPRALGNRSILADARNPQMQSHLNRKIKFRESFRPFAPAVLRDEADQFFEVPADWDSPYMLAVAGVRAEHRLPPAGELPGTGEHATAKHATGADHNATGADHNATAAASLLERVQRCRSDVPAVTHVDYSARVQTVDSRNGRFCRLLHRFHDLTQCPLLINTSFNVRDEPIVCSPDDAYRCFMNTRMDALVLEDILLIKDQQPDAPIQQPAAEPID